MSGEAKRELVVRDVQSLVSASTGVAAGRMPVVARLMYDASASIRDNKPSLVEPLKGAATEFEIGLASNERNLLSRALFHRTVIEIDRRSFLEPSLWRASPMANFYVANGDRTSLDVVYYSEIKPLCERFEAQPDGVFHLLMVFTDGRNNGEDLAAKVRARMAHVVDLANTRCDGVLRTRIMVAYIGIGLSREEHLRNCTVRYGIPEQWFKWYPAGEDEVCKMGEEMSQSVSEFSDGNETRFW
ncbi:MAG: hypothetical protein U0136_15770 [Bdellovibrionota bacterium]